MANPDSDLPRGDDTGLDPEIKDLEIEVAEKMKINKAQAAYATLLARAGGPHELKEWFVEAGFILNFPLAQKKQHMVESDKEEMKEKLLALAQRFKEIGLITGTYESISDLEANLEKWECCVCLLKYQERWGNRYWRNKWAKQARGTVLFINPEDQSDVRCLSYKLERGAEVSTRRHAQEGIGETQDLKEGRVAIFDDETIRSCTTLAKGGAISGHLSSKGDGSYFGVTLARGLLGQIWDAVTDGFASDWVKMWKRKGKAYGESHGINDLVMVPATQGGIMQGDHMLGYMTTALLVGNGLATREQLGLCEDSVAAMDQYGSVIFQRLAAIAAQQLPEPGCKVVSFENICENRRGLFGDHEHTELACRYTRDRCIVLGLSDCASKLYTPHSAFDTAGFEEPIYWLITHSDQINELIDKLDDLVWGSITEADFLAMFPPANPEKLGDPTIDYEGFVFMETKPMESTTGNGVTYMYRKIKGLAYYKSHKLHADNLPYLLRLGERAGHIFPVAQRALELLSPGVFQRKMGRVLEQVLTLLDFSDQNPLLDRIRAGHAAALAKAQAAGSKKLPKDPLVGFEQRSVDAQCRMAVNIQHSNFPAEVADIFQAQFPSIDLQSDLIFGLKSIVMSVKPWIPKGEVGSFTDEISTDHPLFRPFIMACLGQSIAS